MTFVRASDLTPEQVEALNDLGREGSVVVREQIRPVVSSGLKKPAKVAAEIQARIPFTFNMHHFILAWRKLNCRPASDAANPERTDERYCVYDEPHQDYLYKPAFIEKVVRETDTEDKFRKFLGTDPITK